MVGLTLQLSVKGWVCETDLTLRAEAFLIIKSLHIIFVNENFVVVI